MISQSERIEGFLGPSIRTSLLFGLQDRLERLEKMVINELKALGRQNIKPEEDRLSKPSLGSAFRG